MNIYYRTPPTHIQEYLSRISNLTVISGFGLCFMFFSYAFFRLGLTTNYLTLVFCGFIFLAVTTGPILVFQIIRLPWKLLTYWYPIISILILIIPTLIFNTWSIYFYILVGIAGLVALRVSTRRGLDRTHSSSTTIWLTIGKLLLIGLSALAAISVKHSQQVGHFFSHEFALLNMLHRDTIHHAAVSAMTNLFGYPTTGIDGANWFHYHFGSHYWFGNLTESLAIPVTVAYPIIHLLLIALFWFYFLLLCFYTNYFFYNKRTSKVILIGLLTILISDYILFMADAPTYYTSESFTFSLVLLFSAFASLVSVIHYQTLGNSFYRIGYVALFLNCCILVSKIVPALYFSGITTLYFLFSHARKKRFLIWIFTLTASWISALYFLTPLKSLILATYSPITTYESPFRIKLLFQLSEITSLFIIVIFILGAVLSQRYFPATTRRSKNRRFFHESLSTILVVGLLIGLIDFFNSLREYLYITGALLAISFLGSQVSHHVNLKPIGFLSTPRLQKYFKPISTVAVVFGIISLSIFAYDMLTKISNLEAKLRFNYINIVDSTKSIYKKHPDVATFMEDNYSRHHLLLSQEITKYLDSSFWSEMIDLANTETRKFGPKHTAVFVPPSNTQFWNFTDVDTCTYKPLYIPAVLGIPAIKGLPPRMAKCEFIGHGHDFSGFSEMSHSSVIADLELCNYARTRRIYKIIIMKNFTLPLNYRVLACV